MRVEFVGSGDAFGSGGRYHTCQHLSGDDLDVVVDLGATAFHALKRTVADLNRVTTVLVTHFHGDHFGGLPYFDLDAQFVSHRRTPLTLVGPPGIERRWRDLLDASYPGFASSSRAFPLIFREISPGETIEIDAAVVTAREMQHDPKAGICLGYRIAAANRTYVYSGDTTWTDELIPLAEGADLFVAECYVRSRKMAVHMDYATLLGKLPEIAAKRVILTHMGPDMLDHLEDIGHETAHDGLTIVL
ncbi:MAG: MBL fold metallo-hydrolase [Ancalomicrobiaceae bacterium]|nr:MBL fold metallo-hydrolase [Ancalomicrobiaceae bacterium]